MKEAKNSNASEMFGEVFQFRERASVNLKIG